MIPFHPSEPLTINCYFYRIKSNFDNFHACWLYCALNFSKSSSYASTLLQESAFINRCY